MDLLRKLIKQPCLPHCNLTYGFSELSPAAVPINRKINGVSLKLNTIIKLFMTLSSLVFQIKHHLSMKHFFLLTVACVYKLILFAQSGFVIYPGINVVKSGSPVLVLKNMNLVNNGTFVPGNGTVQLTGTNAISVNGTSPINFYNLYAGSSGSVVLGQNITIQNDLKMAGMMQVQNQEVKLEPTAFISDESETARLQASAGNTGHAMITLDMNLPVVNFNPAKIGVEFVSAPALGTTKITRYCTAFSGGSLAANVIQRYYNVQPANNSSLNASVRFYYFDAELNGVDENASVLWKSNDNGVSWLQVAPDSRDIVKNYLQKDGVNDFSLWTIGSPSAALPILLSSFNVSCNNNGAQLIWTTAWEQNNDKFIVEKSKDAAQWEEIAVISARNMPSDYKFSDVEAGNTYYRLKQVDKDGTFTYSKILRSNCAIASITLLIYPNPVTDHTDLVFQSDKNFSGTVQVFSTSGQLVKNIGVQVQRGQNKIRINLPGLMKGTYMLRLNNGETQVEKKFIKL